MKATKVFTVLTAIILLTVLTASSLQAEEPDTKHWFEITVAAGNSTANFTGSTTLDAASIARSMVSPAATISLSDLRGYGARKFDDQMHWMVIKPSNVTIASKSIIYFKELEGDPISVKDE